ncbi:MAG TPA: prolyl oligopeptidase family serine peptidase [Thermoanaerobaculia bacterium]
MIARQFVVGFALLVIGTCSPQSRFLERKVTVEGRVYRYRVFLPARYTKLRRWPVILFLHGSNERGDDNLRQLTIGLPPLLARDPARYRAIVVVPQCPTGHEWYGESETQALAALDASIKEFRGDRRRVYLTGISMGGAGVWFLARHRARWAAVVPVCGEVVRERDDPFPIAPPADIAKLLNAPDPYAAFATAIGSTPVWIFHGAEDNVISVEQSRRMYLALRARHANVRYTEYAGLGHDVWDRAYAEPTLPTWLLAQRQR